jgi:hypothetical protein
VSDKFKENNFCRPHGKVVIQPDDNKKNIVIQAGIITETRAMLSSSQTISLMLSLAA